VPPKCDIVEKNKGDNSLVQKLTYPNAQGHWLIFSLYELGECPPSQESYSVQIEITNPFLLAS